MSYLIVKICQIIFFDNHLQDLKVMYINIRSIYQNLYRFLVFLEFIQRNFDIILMPETHKVYYMSDFIYQDIKYFLTISHLVDEMAVSMDN